MNSKNAYQDRVQIRVARVAGVLPAQLVRVAGVSPTLQLFYTTGKAATDAGTLPAKRFHTRSQHSNNRSTPIPGLPHAFSLIELLVTVAVIGLLLSVLLPALGRARDQSNLLVCQTRLRTLALGALMYAADHNSYLPLAPCLDNPHTRLMSTLTDNRYVENILTFYCPSDKRTDLCYTPQNVQLGQISYFYYSFTDRPTNRYLSNFFLKTLPWPRILRDTLTPDTWIASDSWFSNLPTAHRWYKKGVNYVTLDTAVHLTTEGPRSAFK